MRAHRFSPKAQIALSISVLLLSGVVSILLYQMLATNLVLFFPLLIGILFIFHVRHISQSAVPGLLEHKPDDTSLYTQTQELEALQRASLQVTSSLELTQILETILTNASELIHADDVHIFLYDGEHLSFGAALWADQSQREPYREPRPEGVTYTVARSGQALLIPDANAHPLYQNWKWGGAIAGLPLRIGDRVCGVMNIAFDQPHHFSDNEVRILALFADQAAIAIQNAQLYESVRHQAATMEQAIIKRTTELRDAKERAETVFNNSFDAILVLTPQGKIEQANRASQILFGLSNEALLRYSIADFVHPDVKNAFLSQLDTLEISHASVRTEVTLQRLDKSQFVADIAVTALPKKDNTSPNWVCSIRDISQRKRAEDQQQTMTAGLRRVLSIANELMSCTDTDSVFRQAVESARNELGLERCGLFIERNDVMYGTYGTDKLGQTTDEHGLSFHVGEAWRERLEKLKPNDAQWIILEDNNQMEWNGSRNVPVGRGWIVITRIPSTDGSRGLLFNDSVITGRMLDETQQEIVAVYCSLLGRIIEQKQIEDNVQQALFHESELSELRSRVIDTISHEFRTPMAIIQSSAQLLKHYSDRMDDVKRRGHFATIETQIEQMTSMLENVITISQADAGQLLCQPRLLDTAALCQKLIEEAHSKSANGISITFSQHGNCSDANLDERLTRQIVTNLLSNAVKYSRPGGLIQFNLTCDPQQVIIRIQDEGIGIPEKDQKNLFINFQRASNVGTISGVGLGLAIIKRASEAHGGTATFESTEGVGTTFTITLSTLAAKPALEPA